MSKQSHVCPICYRSNFVHTNEDVKICKSRIKKNRISLDRSYFSHAVKELAKKQQKGKCPICKEYWTHAESHHISDRCDNSLDNCVILCHDCHFEITYLRGSKASLVNLRDRLDELI